MTEDRGRETGDRNFAGLLNKICDLYGRLYSRPYIYAG